jgi:hypothetical protein
MALQNQRALYWRAEDLGFGGGNTRENTVRMTVQASARPVLQTYVTRGQIFLPQALMAPSLSSVAPQIRAIVNRSPCYYLTLIATLQPFGTGGTAMPIHLPIPPLQTLFLPNNVVSDSATQVVANSTFPLPNSTGAASVPVASSTTPITFDVLVEQ